MYYKTIFLEKKDLGEFSYLMELKKITSYAIF